MSAIEKIASLRKAYEDAVKELGNAVISEVFGNFWAAAPENLLAVTWTQYTPHFNDGDPCEFNVHEIDSGLFEGDDPDEFNPWTENLWELEYESKEGPYSDWVLSPLGAALKETNQVLQDNEDILRTVFGDGVQVTVRRDGTVTVDEYDHD